ncbi:hypothetical protein ACFYKX_13515 [Cytobacillus sp. FJAT-54145]|uniref:PQ loop repeat protein n=1 Tax=Cytobacillus spartinae TaxID=3299023 RepID=A0ABW6KDH3_9BACI
MSDEQIFYILIGIQFAFPFLITLILIRKSKNPKLNKWIPSLMASIFFVINGFAWWMVAIDGFSQVFGVVYLFGGFILTMIMIHIVLFFTHRKNGSTPK